ncbi:hypothetical protein WDU94_015549 [Cyamophila willieti]
MLLGTSSCSVETQFNILKHNVFRGELPARIDDFVTKHIRFNQSNMLLNFNYEEMTEKVDDLNNHASKEGFNEDGINISKATDGKMNSTDSTGDVAVGEDDRDSCEEVFGREVTVDNELHGNIDAFVEREQASYEAEVLREGFLTDQDILDALDESDFEFDGDDDDDDDEEEAFYSQLLGENDVQVIQTLLLSTPEPDLSPQDNLDQSQPDLDSVQPQPDLVQSQPTVSVPRRSQESWRLKSFGEGPKIPDNEELLPSQGFVSARDSFMEYLNEDFFENCSEKTNLYSVQNSNSHRSLNCTPEEIMRFTAVEILMGSLGLPQAKLYCHSVERGSRRKTEKLGTATNASSREILYFEQPHIALFDDVTYQAFYENYILDTRSNANSQATEYAHLDEQGNPDRAYELALRDIDHSL